MIQIQNMYLAAALLSYKFHFVEVDKSDKDHQKFVFDNVVSSTIYIQNPGTGDPILTVPGASVEDVEQFFISESLMLPPSYPEAIRRVKYILHSTSRDVDNGEKRSRTGSGKMLPNRQPFDKIG